MRSKNIKTREIKKEKVKKSFSSVFFMGLSLFLTVMLFMGLVIVQKLLLDDITYKEVVIAKTDIPQNTIITEENLETYFTIKSMNILDTTTGTIIDATQLVGQKAVVSLYSGEIVSLKDFENLSKYIEGLENPVEISIQITDIASADGGKIRAGDLINLTMMFTNEQLGKDDYTAVNPYNPYQSNNKFTDTDGLLDTNTTLPKVDNINEIEDTDVVMEEDFSVTTSQYRYETWAQYVMENLYVYKALDASGLEIDPTNTEALASILIFIIDKDSEADLNNALANCSSMRISKCYKKPGFAYIDISVIGENGDILSEDHIQTEVTPAPTITPSPEPIIEDNIGTVNTPTAVPTEVPEQISTEPLEEIVKPTALPQTDTVDTEV